MSRSLKVAPEYIVKVKQSLQRNGFPSQQALADTLGIARDTVSKFLNGKPVDYLNFVEISERLGLDWQQIASKEETTPPPPSPFIPGIPTTQPRYFFGRQRELKRIFDLLKRHPLQNAAIIGKRRSGKTSLLHYLKNITTTPAAQLRPNQKSDWLPHPENYRWIFVDLQDARMQSREGLLGYILECLEMAIPNPCDLDKFMDAVSGKLHKPTVILLDEIGVGLQRCPELDDGFWESLRSLATNYLSTSRQRWAAQAVQIELDARELESCADVAAISNAHRTLAVGELNSPISSLLRIFTRISQDVSAAINQGSTYNQRLVLTAVAEKLNGLIRELTRSSDKYSVRFRPIATQWSEIVSNYIRELAEAIELRQEIDNPYLIGVPLTEQQDIFTGRTHLGTRIEQLILDRRRPPLLLYGQRRMGKTSLLNNLGRLLPNSIIPMFVDLQGPVSSASDYAGFLYNIARAMIDSAKRQSAVTLPPLTRETLALDPFTSFDEWLDKVEQTLDQKIALLSLDEFEALDDAISKGRFDEQEVLGMLRHLIQHRPRFKLLLAGSHTIEEFQRWASYLINVQVLHISYLKEPEARQLIERPVKDFTLRYEPDAVERVLQLTRCHPFLVQLLCAEIIYLKNEQDPSVRRLATLADVEAATPAALNSGSFFFADIQNNQVGAGLADNSLSQINNLSTKPALTDGLADNSLSQNNNLSPKPAPTNALADNSLSQINNLSPKPAPTNALALLRFIAAQGEGATVSREVLSRQFADNLDSILESLLRRELIEEIAEGYRFQVELIRRWFT